MCTVEAEASFTKAFCSFLNFIIIKHRFYSIGDL